MVGWERGQRGAGGQGEEEAAAMDKLTAENRWVAKRRERERAGESDTAGKILIMINVILLLPE